MRDEIATTERAAKSIQEKLDRLDEAFLFERSIDIETYDRHAEKLREELPLARIDRHSGQLEELDVEGILALAERVLRRAADLWVQASLEQRQRFQQLCFPDGIAFDGKGIVGTRVTAPAFSYLRTIEDGNEGWWPRTAPVGTDRLGQGLTSFRLDDAGKIVEHWDALQRVPNESANSNTMVGSSAAGSVAARSAQAEHQEQSRVGIGLTRPGMSDTHRCSSSP